MNTKITDAYWMAFARKVGEAGTCRVGVGAALVQDGRVIGLGRVGSVHGDVHCSDVSCWLEPAPHRGSSGTGLSCVRTIHAEVNCVLNATKISGSMITCYCTHAPCWECLKVLIQFGVSRVVYDQQYKDSHRDKWLAATQVPIMFEELKS